MRAASRFRECAHPGVSWRERLVSRSLEQTPFVQEINSIVSIWIELKFYFLGNKFLRERTEHSKVEDSRRERKEITNEVHNDLAGLENVVFLINLMRFFFACKQVGMSTMKAILEMERYVDIRNRRN